MASQGALHGKVALVTGASRGIGRSIALRFGGAGARVGLNYRASLEEIEAVEREIKVAGTEVKVLQADVSNAAQVQAMFKDIEDIWGGVDILVNNAGVTRDSLLLRMSEEEWDSVIDVNLKGAFLCCRAAVRFMLRKRWGRIINISSLVAQTGNPGQVNYSASKAGLIGMTRTLARELATRKITVNAVTPGFISTEMVESLSEDVKEYIRARIPMERFGAPEDVAAVVEFLASKDAGYITGQVIGVDGGIVL